MAKDYDPSFLNRESLETLMKRDLKANFKIDLIVEEKAGYSVLRVSELSIFILLFLIHGAKNILDPFRKASCI